MVKGNVKINKEKARKVEDDVPPTVSVYIYTNLIASEDITLDASESTDNVGIISYEWNFNDDTTASGNTDEPKFN